MDVTEEKAEIDIAVRSQTNSIEDSNAGCCDHPRFVSLRKRLTPDYPRSVFFILLNELCERFSYYGMRAVLILYLVDFLRMGRGTAVTVYHFFIMACYFSPLLGGWISDTYWGRFKTILVLSLVYVVVCSQLN
jgi:dipeptide/tripeptide permease